MSVYGMGHGIIAKCVIKAPAELNRGSTVLRFRSKRSYYHSPTESVFKFDSKKKSSKQGGSAKLRTSGLPSTTRSDTEVVEFCVVEVHSSPTPSDVEASTREKTLAQLFTQQKNAVRENLDSEQQPCCSGLSQKKEIVILSQRKTKSLEIPPEDFLDSVASNFATKKNAKSLMSSRHNDEQESFSEDSNCYIPKYFGEDLQISPHDFFQPAIPKTFFKKNEKSVFNSENSSKTESLKSSSKFGGLERREPCEELFNPVAPGTFEKAKPARSKKQSCGFQQQMVRREYNLSPKKVKEKKKNVSPLSCLINHPSSVGYPYLSEKLTSPELRILSITRFSYPTTSEQESFVLVESETTKSDTVTGSETDFKNRSDVGNKKIYRSKTKKKQKTDKMPTHSRRDRQSPRSGKLKSDHGKSRRRSSSTSTEILCRIPVLSPEKKILSMTQKSGKLTECKTQSKHSTTDEENLESRTSFLSIPSERPSCTDSSQVQCFPSAAKSTSPATRSRSSTAPDKLQKYKKHSLGALPEEASCSSDQYRATEQYTTAKIATESSMKSSNEQTGLIKQKVHKKFPFDNKTEQDLKFIDESD